ncbi:N-acetylmuramidase family protein [Aureimonas ureilytica]|uniref:N-acetylmuramidase family protein n=1 Tax=Aureimonas ureilytica TaxID=401562 RepID=UPI00037C9957|nr:N-acetylmuramidase family protein [Aureimonas ureilytica]
MADFNGFRGAAKPLDDIDLPRLGYRIGVGEDEIHAVIDVETAGGAWDAKGRPKMLFEPHRFWKNLGAGAKRDRAVKAGLAYPSWGERPYPKDSYPRLIEAMAIDETAALKSASWGLGQILGENHAMVGYDTVQEMVLASLDDADKHLEMMVAFILSAKLDGKLRAHDWAGFARGYNGPQYAKNGYHTKLEAAFKRWAKIRDTPWSPADEVIRVPVPTPRPDDAPAPTPQPEPAKQPPVASGPLDLSRYSKMIGSLAGVLIGWAVGENFIPPAIAAQLDPATIDLIVTAIFGAIGTYLAPPNASKPAT